MTFPNDFPLRPELPATGSVEIKAGELTQVEIPLQKAVRISGVVLERGTGHPIAGLPLLINNGREITPQRVETDAAGRYSTFVLPGPVYTIPGVPASFPPRTPERQRALITEFHTEVRTGAAEQELPPIDLARTATVR
jgi:hypothetical protein